MACKSLQPENIRLTEYKYIDTVFIGETWRTTQNVLAAIVFSGSSSELKMDPRFYCTNLQRERKI